MGADLITVSYTTRSGMDPEDGEAEAAIIAHLEAIRKDIGNIDHHDWFERHECDEDLHDEDGEDALLPALMEGWKAHKEGHLSNQYTIPGTTKEEVLWLNILGAETWGDSPFEGFDELCILIEAIDRFPSLGQRLGILGGGIVIPGREVY